MNKLLPLFLFACLALLSCENQTSTTPTDLDFEAELQENINKAKDGDVIELPEGTYHISHTLVISRAENVTILGKGRDKTILDFQSKQDSMDGWKIVSDGAVLQDFTIRNASGNGIIAERVRGITCHAIKISHGSSNKGSSGIYMHDCSQSLVEECEASGFARSGIEIISSEEVIARRNTLHENTAGLETVNCAGVDIIDNTVSKNTVGMIIANTATAIKKNGGRYRILNNHVENNNLENTAPAGTLAFNAPTGTGILLIAANYADIINNNINGQKVTGIAILSNFDWVRPSKIPSGMYSSAIYIHNNKLAADSVKTKVSGPLGEIFAAAFGKKLPDIIYDGYVNPNYLNTDGTIKDERKICIQNNENATFGNMDLPGGGAHRSTDIQKCDCGLPGLIEVKLN